MNYTDILVQKNIISKDELRKIKSEAGPEDRRLEESLMAHGVSEDSILAAKGEILGLPIRRIKEVGRIPFDILKSIPEESARHYQMIPLGFKDKVLEVGMVNPENTEAKEALRFISSRMGVGTKIFLIS